MMISILGAPFTSIFIPSKTTSKTTSRNESGIKSSSRFTDGKLAAFVIFFGMNVRYRRIIIAIGIIDIMDSRRLPFDKVRTAKTAIKISISTMFPHSDIDRRLNTTEACK